MVKGEVYSLYDTVEMKKAHPCGKKNKLFQIVRLGADVKIRCLACGRTIMMDRDYFDSAVRKKVAGNEVLLKIEGQ